MMNIIGVSLLLVLPFLIQDAVAGRAGGLLVPSNTTSNIQDDEVHDARMTINGFQKGQDGGGPSECDGKYHSNNQKIVALSSHWYHGRCGKCIRIKWRGKSTTAKVVDECDTSGGCKTNIVDASKAVWNSLGIKKGSSQFGETGVTWEEC